MDKQCLIDSFPARVEFDYQSLLTICHLNKNGDNNYTMKVVKQKFLIDNLEYIFHEIFGLENKTTPTTSNKREEVRNKIIPFPSPPTPSPLSPLLSLSVCFTINAITVQDCDNDSCSSSEDEDDLGAECVICFTDVKDTIILPCRHFCLCASCGKGEGGGEGGKGECVYIYSVQSMSLSPPVAADLRYQASNCPICRAR